MDNEDKFKWTTGQARSVTLRYGLALLSVAAALGLASVFAYFHLPQSFGTFALTAIAITFWYAGTAPGVLAAVVSSLVRDYLFEPNTSIESRLLFDLVFLVFALLMTRVVRGRKELEQRVAERTAELTRLNENLKSEIAEHNRVEAELRLSEAYLAEAQRLSHTGSWARNPATGENRCWSDECFRLMGFDPAAGMPPFETVAQRFHPDDQPVFGETLGRAKRERAEFEVDYRIIHPGGEIRDIHAVGHPVLGPSGDLVEFVGSVIDVTERKQAEDNIRQSENELRHILDFTPQQVAVLGPDRARLYVNQATLDYFGLAFEEWQSGDRRRFMHPDDWERMMNETQSKFISGIPHEAELRLRGKDGKYRWFLFRYNPLRDEQGRLRRWYVAGTDIEDRKEAEELLRQAQANLAHANRVTTMGELTASLAHEVNQPIAAAVTGASTCVRWLTRDDPDIAEAREAALGVVRNGKRAADIINRIRALSRKGDSQRQLVDINEIIVEIIALLQNEAKRYSISIRTDLGEDLPRIMADSLQVQQVMMNLIMNSIDAMKDADQPRVIFVRSQSTEDQHLTISVSDTGVGLPPQQADKIFEAFFTTKPHGIGLGLRISRTIIESHGGRLWATPNSPSGASFYFALPTIPAAAE